MLARGSAAVDGITAVTAPPMSTGAHRVRRSASADFVAITVIEWSHIEAERSGESAWVDGCHDAARSSRPALTAQVVQRRTAKDG